MKSDSDRGVEPGLGVPGRAEAIEGSARPGFPDGLLLVDKPAGMTSFDVIRRIRPHLAGREPRGKARRKIGHTGTLDPFATGLLAVCLGEATKLASLIVEGEKEYVARIRLGERTDTGDPDGAVIETYPVPLLAGDRVAVEEIVHGLVGIHRQTPPMHSAVRIGGERLYARAHRNETIERPDREVEIRALGLLDLAPGEVVVRVECSKGTYVRVLAEKIAESLGTVGHLRELRRTRVGDLGIERAASIETILATAWSLSGPPAWFIALDECLPALPAIDLDPAPARKVLHGQVVDEIVRSWPDPAHAGGLARIRCQGRLLAIARRATPEAPPGFVRVLAPPVALAEPDGRAAGAEEAPGGNSSPEA